MTGPVRLSCRTGLIDRGAPARRIEEGLLGSATRQPVEAGRPVVDETLTVRETGRLGHPHRIPWQPGRAGRAPSPDTSRARRCTCE
jgi:hypothetical protein